MVPSSIAASSSSSIPLLPLYKSNSTLSLSVEHDVENPPAVIPPRLSVTIRFASSLPDLDIPFDRPYATTISVLRRQIRTLRPQDTAKRRLKLIYAGKVLGDGNVLGDAVGLARTGTKSNPTPITNRDDKHEEEQALLSTQDRKGKGKERDTNIGNPVEDIPIRRVYIHCSIGDELSDKELLEEAENESIIVQQQSSILPAPQGFDRLLSAGFTEADVAALRSQFHETLLAPTGSTSNTVGLSLLDEEARRHALSLEERWIDESANAANAEVNNANGGVWGAGSGGSYEDFLIGVMWGFFWPVCVVWMFREEGLLGSQRKKMAVLAGLLVNFAFSVLRFSS